LTEVREEIGRLLVVGSIEPESAAALLFSPVHCVVRMFEQVVDFFVVMRIDGNSDADANRDLAALDLKWGRNSFDDPFRDYRNILL
jgi:hypothetical protein